MLSFTSDQWVIVALIFLLGLLVGGFMFSGGGRKWKQRHTVEVERRRELEAQHAEREKAWREQDSLREAALKQRERDLAAATPVVAAAPIAVSRPVVVDTRDVNRDGVVEASEAASSDRPAGIVDRMLGRTRDADRDGIPDDRE